MPLNFGSVEVLALHEGHCSKEPYNIDKLFSMASMGREKGSIPDRTTGAKPNWSRPTRVKVAGHRDRIGIRSRVLNHKFTVGAKRRPPQVTIRLDASQDERQDPSTVELLICMALTLCVANHGRLLSSQ